MNQEFIQILKPVINKTLKKFISLIDTSKIKDRRLKEKAQKHIGRLTNESIKITLAIIEYSISIIEKKREDAIKDIQKNKYGGPFNHSQATKIYNSLKKIIDIFTKSLKKSNKKKNFSELKKMAGGSNTQLIDKNGDFTNEMDNILTLSGGLSGGTGTEVGRQLDRQLATAAEHRQAFDSQPRPIVATRGEHSLGSIRPRAEIDQSPDHDAAAPPPPYQPLDIIAEKFGTKSITWLAKVISSFIGLLNPYLNFNESRGEKIDNASPFFAKIITRAPTSSDAEDPEGIGGVLARIKRFFDQFIFAPSTDFPSEYGINNKAGTKSLGHALLGFIGISLLIIFMFIPASPIIQIINPIILINAIYTKRRLLAVITIINIISSLIFGPFSALFIQGPLYLFYFIDGQKYLRMYQNRLKGKPNIRQVESKELEGTYIIKKSSRGAVVGRFQDKISEKEKEIDKLKEKIEKTDDEAEKTRLEEELGKKNSHLKIERAQKAAADEKSYDKLEDRHNEVLDTLDEAKDRGHELDNHKELEQHHLKKIQDIDTYKSIDVTEDSPNSYFNQLYILYKKYRMILRLASRRSSTRRDRNLVGDERDQANQEFHTPRGHREEGQTEDLVKRERDLNREQFKQSILGPYINKAASAAISKNPFQFGSPLALRHYLARRGLSTLRENKDMIIKEAVGLIKILKGGFTSEFWGVRDYVQEGYLNDITDYDLLYRTIPANARSALGPMAGQGGGATQHNLVSTAINSKKGGSILDLYRSPL